MNAPLFQHERPDRSRTFRLFALFHLNLAFSSIEEDQRSEVIERCYWPLLRLAEKFGPFGIEATGFTLEEIAARDPLWIAKMKSLLADGRVELIGSGYSQLIGPLVPARVNQANLLIGDEIYRQLLGTKPTVALINEQAYSAGLVSHYLDAGYRAVAMDWDNPGAVHPEWHSETRYLPQRALGADGRSIELLWTNTVAFQKMQRMAHRDLELDTYLEYVHGRQAESPRALCIYASDAEIFDFRPGRYKTEEKCGDESEWSRIELALASLTADFPLVAPSDVLHLLGETHAGQTLRLETAACPVPVKKQRKYNLARWAVTGRDNVGINTACERIYRGMLAGEASSADWKELCYLWASDFRTHVTAARWSAFRQRLRRAEARWSAPLAAVAPFPEGAGVSERRIEISTPHMEVRLDRRRGLALERVRFANQARAALGGLAHGHFDDIALQADWYTGDSVFEAPGEHKITDLEWAETNKWVASCGDVFVQGRIDTAKGPIEKTLRFAHEEPRIDFDLTFFWNEFGKGSLRLGHFTLLPDAFDSSDLTLTTQNGGLAVESFALRDQSVDHGAPVSFLVSSSQGLGMTEGWVELGDSNSRLRIEVDRSTASLLGMLTYRIVGESIFCQLILSALELDDTRKPDAYLPGPRRFRFSLSGVERQQFRTQS